MLNNTLIKKSFWILRCETIELTRVAPIDTKIIAISKNTGLRLAVMVDFFLGVSDKKNREGQTI